ncbi:hypothetical protein DCS_05871 [Drechmeria coniospora]|uniref:Uncharacterized protein n=1 Tax=Drechmeria coniospora TaxID=98403 RepID=A0A151GP24_DRECN|nr:hypothetical protein DCS_05871 [Drechmeria coniospora]KYK58853.1 hypothetical protein DCS_05871 [Drechmeria coniospora]
MPWLPGDRSKCHGDGTSERCLGTAEFCDMSATANVTKGLHPDDVPIFLSLKQQKTSGGTSQIVEAALKHYYQQVRECLAARDLRPFSIIYSSRCNGEGHTEDCMGSKAWCSRPESIKLHGSQEQCLNQRQRSPRKLSNWQFPAAKNQTCISANEACEGSELVCMKGVPFSQRAECLAARTMPLWMWPSSLDQFPDAEVQESVNGSDWWCHNRYGWMNYVDEIECFETRGLQVRNFSDALFKVVRQSMRDTIREMSIKLARNAALHELITNQASAGDAMNATKAEVRLFLKQTLINVKDVIPKSVQVALEHISQP